MAYTTQQAIDALNDYLEIKNEDKTIISDTKDRGFVLDVGNEKVVIFVYPLVHKQDNTKNYFDTRDSGAYERSVTWKYALQNGMKYFCFGVNSAVDKYEDYIFSLECNERVIEKISGTKDGDRNGPGNQIIIPNNYIPSHKFERIQNKLGIFISVIHREGLREYIDWYDNRPYMPEITEEMEDDEVRNKRLFRYWLGQQVKPEGDSDAGNPYKPSVIDAYVSNIANTPHPSVSGKSIFFTTDVETVKQCLQKIEDGEAKNNTQRSAVKKYMQYLTAEKNVHTLPIFKTGYISQYDRNRIVFGAPGTGKSYALKDDCRKLMENSTGLYERVTFHPDYSYSQFVGTYKPITDNDGKIRYDFVPGPFMRIYVEALRSARTDNPQPFLLLIEEINRAKVAAVFGDVFQLLDRDDDNVSEYEIQASEDIQKYLAKPEVLGGYPEDYKKIRIPDNMFIWSTMNSADQGVFPMDTAFKRRWSFEYLGINENEKEISGIGKFKIAGCDEPVEWNILRRAINEKMSEFKVNEDKLMGPFFLSKKLIASDESGMIIDTEKFIQAFKSKVIMYLYEDAVKQKKHDFFAGCDSSKYSSVCDAFDEIGIGIFESNFKEKYDTQRNGL